MYGIFFPFESNLSAAGGTNCLYHSSSSVAAVPVSSAAMASAFRFADRRSLAFRLPSLSSSAMDALSFLADSSFVLSSSESCCNAADAWSLLCLLLFFFPPVALLDDALCRSYHSIKCATPSHPDSSTAMASALRLADRRSLAFRSSGLDSNLDRARSSFSAAADLARIASSAISSLWLVPVALSPPLIFDIDLSWEDSGGV
mmetsp:Transcript_23664/g.50646  ORF Transcript_23664/g.50646 Transcript_23664/m.50646 type:complete len:202 (-) Transcript_23664:104-709(-)